MAADKRLETLQEEIKLMKGELKQSLASVRDYLLNMELPSSEISTILAALNADGAQTVTMKGSLGTPTREEAQEAKNETEEQETEQEVPKDEQETIEDEVESPPEDEQLLDMQNPGQDAVEEETLPEENIGDTESANEEALPEDELETPEEIVEEEPGSDKLTGPEPSNEEETPMDYETTNADVNLSIPRVNMLANLISWVSRANREIGKEQLPVFLEVYGISGHLSPELKEVIIHLSDIIADQEEAASRSEIWSDAMLLLHGVLTGGDAPLHPVVPAWKEEDLKNAAEEEIIEVDKGRDRPVKLKFVFPNSEGNDQEYSIDLMPQPETSDG